MTLRQCKKCGNPVSSDAKSCPNCGKTIKKDPGCLTGCLGLIVIFIVANMIWFAISGEEKHTAKNSPPPKPKTQVEIRQDKIESQFSPWDGSHRNLERLIKQTMNDPKSYEHVKTVYWDNKKYLVVKTIFRGKNAFGGVVVNWVKAKVNLDGQILEILEQGP